MLNINKIDNKIGQCKGLSNTFIIIKLIIYEKSLNLLISKNFNLLSIYKIYYQI